MFYFDSSDVSPGAYYLSGDLAVLEFDLSVHLCHVVEEMGFKQFTGPDFVKAVVMVTLLVVLELWTAVANVALAAYI